MSALAAIFPKVRAEILRLLFAKPSAELHLREIMRQSHLTLGTIQQEVARLSNADLLTVRRDGNRLYYRANTQHPIFLELQGIALKTTGLREQLLSVLADIPGIDLAFVYGSIASDAAGAGSDVDLLIVGTVGLRALAPRLRPLSVSLGREINPHILSRKAIADRVQRGDAYIANLLTSPKLWIIGSPDELGNMV
jgi:DNA-binding transcriptional ArsR family regulator